MERVIVYVDGFNLYFGMKGKGWRELYWLDVQKMAERMMRPNQQLVRTKYFTSRVSSTPKDPDKALRQQAFLEALTTVSGLDIFFGHYVKEPTECRCCGTRWLSFREKMTDVNIAVQVLADGFQDRMDTAIVVSGDGDLTVLVQQYRLFFPRKRIVMGFPPGRSLNELSQAANGFFVIGRSLLSASQLPASVKHPRGHTLHRPPRWT